MLPFRPNTFLRSGWGNAHVHVRCFDVANRVSSLEVIKVEATVFITSGIGTLHL